MNPRTLFRPLTGMIAALGLFAASQADAHAHLVKADPVANATVASPQTITLQFSEKLEPKFSGFELMKSDGGGVAITSSVSDKTITGGVKTRLAPGIYMVMWHVVSSDGHRMEGNFTFTVK